MGDLVANRADVVVAPLSFTHERRYKDYATYDPGLYENKSKYIPLQSLHRLHASLLWGAFLLLCQRTGHKEKPLYLSHQKM